MTRVKPSVSVDQESGFIEPYPQNGNYLKIDKLKMINDLTNKIWIMKSSVETQQLVGELLDVIATMELEQKSLLKQQEQNATKALSELLGTIEARFQNQKSTAQQYSLIILNQLKACALIHPSIANLICGCKLPNSSVGDWERLNYKIFDLLTTLPTRDLRESVAQVIRTAVLRKGEKEQVALQTNMNLSEVLQNFWKDAKSTQINQQSELYFTYSSPFCSIPDSPIDNIFRSVEEASSKGKQKIDPTNQ
ncbi:MAG: hypothetical protein EZS28_025040 [Streblomastix strix]|uniref:Uncharacterized protein n=1 Tax=Streblomastix strix TaxID=222440 RepID=A0A5J4VAA7_9EUKA|nr:MAG: hypothetical protein EZS28_025040 [Streblomastix strix]